jgi:hypothetical protein
MNPDFAATYSMNKINYTLKQPYCELTEQTTSYMIHHIIRNGMNAYMRHVRYELAAEKRIPDNRYMFKSHSNQIEVKYQ